MPLPPFTTHYLHPSRGGENCGMCFREDHYAVAAAHKVGEEGDDLRRHNLTQYLCCKHFAQVMGPQAEEWCNQYLFGLAKPKEEPE